jgi:hypothetical protein
VTASARFACAPRAPSVGFLSSSRRQSSESTQQRASRLAFVPSAAFRALSTAYSSLYLADLFHPAATSRILAPGFLPRPSCTASSAAMSSRRWRRVSIAGCPATPSHVASTSGPCSRPGSAAPPRGVSPASAPVSHRACLLRTLAADLAPAVNGGSIHDLPRTARVLHALALTYRSTDSFDALSLDHPSVRGFRPAV